MYTMYKTHRRVNAPVEFKGLKGRYILYAVGCVIGCMLLFAILYIIGVNNYVCLLLCFGIGTVGIGGAYYMSRHYGVHGWHKRQMARRSPKALRSGSRRMYMSLKS